MIRHTFEILAASVFLAQNAFAQATSEQVLVDVELAVRAPNSQPVDKKTVSITILDQTNPPRPVVSVTADSNGVAQFKVPAGVFRLRIKVPGVGYGSTGATEFRPGVVARPELPPLAGYGSIDGVIPREICTGEVTVGAYTPYVGVMTVAADSSGHFHLGDMPGGDWFLTASFGKDCLCAEGPTISVNVGQALRDVKIQGLKNTSCSTTPTPPVSPAPQAKTDSPTTIGHKVRTDVPVVWASGTVADESRRPIENATVFSLGTYYGGIRMMEILAKATTDVNGHYELKGASGLSNFSATLVATAPGHPPAWAWPAFPQISWFDTDPPVPERVTQNLVLPSKSGHLRVTVLQDGKPAAGVTAAAYLENANLRDMWAYGAGGGVRAEIENVAHPAATSDANGTVSFTNLLPGRYTIYAMATDKVANVRGFASYPHPGSDLPSAIAGGIAVRLGETTCHALNLYVQSSKVSFRVLHPDGQALTGNTPVQFGPVDTVQWTSSVSLDSEGHGQWDLDHGGLWQIRFFHRDGSSTNGARAPDDFREPFDLATAFVAISPNLASGPEPVFQGRHVEAPVAHVLLRDRNDAPVQATVTPPCHSGSWAADPKDKVHDLCANGGCHPVRKKHLTGKMLSARCLSADAVPNL